MLRSTQTLRSAVVVRCHLSTLMGQQKLRVTDVARLTGLNRSTVTALYRETATRIELPAIEKLCALLKCGVGDLLEIVPDRPGVA
ncbi:MAG: helix-turn-helix domain-containing protein [Ramlibacter sp.]